MIIALVGCGRAKLAHPAPARDLYVGGLFRAARRWAELHAAAWYILSAEHGVLAPETVVEPYDRTMADLRRSGRGRIQHPSPVDTWATRCRGQLMGASGNAPRGYRVIAGDRVVILAGADYADPLRPWIEAWGADVEEPLRGFGNGLRLRWLKDGVQ